MTSFPTSKTTITFDWVATIPEFASEERIYYSVIKDGNVYLNEVGPLNDIRFNRGDFLSKNAKIELEDLVL